MCECGDHTRWGRTTSERVVLPKCVIARRPAAAASNAEERAARSDVRKRLLLISPPSTLHPSLSIAHYFLCVIAPSLSFIFFSGAGAPPLNFSPLFSPPKPSYVHAREK